MSDRARIFLLTLVSGAALAQNNPCSATVPVSTLGSAPVAQAAIVYDPNQNICWLANGNLAADAAMQASLGVTGVEPNGSMDYATALRWIAAMNALNKGAGYLGHNDWQLPSAALVDKTCTDIGTNGGSFGPQCTGSAIGNLYSNGLNLAFPASVAPELAASVGPVRNLKASYYWAAQNNGGTSGTDNGGQEMYSFAVGLQGGTTINDTYYYVLPMIAGAIGTPPACSSNGATVVPYASGPAAGNAVYDCATGYTWAADAALGASNAFGISGNVTLSYNSGRTITVPKISNGAMLYATAADWVAGMNAAKYLGSSAWQIPADSKTLQTFASDLGIGAGDARLAWAGSLGPFQNLQPGFYWACQRDASGSSASPCTGYAPANGSSQLQWTFDLDYGFQSTSSLVQRYFVMAFYPAAPNAAPEITMVANAEGESLMISANTWVEIKGSNLAPAGDVRIWQASDFAANGGQMPTQLDRVSVTVGGRNAYVYYISPTQINILTPPNAIADAPPGAMPAIVVTNNGVSSASFAALAQTPSPSFFLLGDGQHVIAVHLNGTLVGPASFSVPGYPYAPAQPGETIAIFANGFGSTSQAVTPGAVTQGGVLSPVPSVKIGGQDAAVQFAGLVSPGLFQFNVVVPASAPNGDLTIGASYNGVSTQAGPLLSVHQ